MGLFVSDTFDSQMQTACLMLNSEEVRVEARLMDCNRNAEINQNGFDSNPKCDFVEKCPWIKKREL